MISAFDSNLRKRQETYHCFDIFGLISFIADGVRSSVPYSIDLKELETFKHVHKIILQSNAITLGADGGPVAMRGLEGF